MNLCTTCYLFIALTIANNLSFHLINGDCSKFENGVDKFSDREKQLNAQLQPLKGKQFSLKDVKESKDKDKYDYYFGICADAKSPDNKPRPNVGALQVKNVEKEEPIVKKLGFYNETELLGGDKWILIKYKGGDIYNRCKDINNRTQLRQTLLMITCGPHLEDKFELIEENVGQQEECYYLFQLESSVACKPHDDSLSGGSIFCIILLTSVALYLLIGFLHQRIVVGAKGLEQIPNYNVWKEFGKLQADGCDFLCRCGERQEAKMYRGIDDHLLNAEGREERDDRLLPM